MSSDDENVVSPESLLPVDTGSHTVEYPCPGCQEKQQTDTDRILTAITNHTTTLNEHTETLRHVVDALNAVGEQNNWITERAGEVFRAFQEMQQKIAQHGIMGMVKGLSSGG